MTNTDRVKELLDSNRRDRYGAKKEEILQIVSRMEKALGDIENEAVTAPTIPFTDDGQWWINSKWMKQIREIARDALRGDHER